MPIGASGLGAFENDALITPSIVTGEWRAVLVSTVALSGLNASERTGKSIGARSGFVARMMKCLNDRNGAQKLPGPIKPVTFRPSISRPRWHD
ncbi:LOW QUALITY PROTEIN: hypothetical protein Ct61P_14459 [Colletotrichum tofieldiae]|nr:LOW QUALITY PROTEIN: hypothetical protein Ct61P_14459 [Colletotrichum tofieldiae]